MSRVQGGGNIVISGLTMYLDAANPKSYVSGSTVWNDISQRGLIGTLTNGPTFSNTKVGSIVFDGVDDYVDIPTSPIVNTSYNNWTIDVWMRPGALVSRFISPSSGGTSFNFITYDAVNQRPTLNISETSIGGNIRVRAGTVRSMLVNNWSMLTISINNLSIKIYVNGILTNTYTETIDIVSWEGSWRLGQRYNNTFWYLGEIAMVKTYSRELSSSEVLQNYNATKSRFGL